MGVLTLLGLHFHIDGSNIYHRAAGYWTVPAYVAVVDGMNAALAWRARRQLGPTALACMLFYTLAPIVSAIVQAVFYGIDTVIMAGILGFIVIFLEMQSHTNDRLVERTEELAQMKEQAANDRIAVMVAQMQPHFLFNTLDAIYELVEADSHAARKAIESFSSYLRTNLSSLNRAEPVPVTTEIDHVRTYLELERTSDPERVVYEIDAEATNFKVPALSVQTLAENAVRHGLGRRAEGGTVRIRTHEHESEYTVTIADDGVGFDTDAAIDTRSHIGIENTRDRLAAMCGGTLEITSEPGAGTLAVMHIPKPGEGAER